MTAILRSPNEVPTQADRADRKLEPALFVRLKTFGAKTRRSDQDILHSGPNRLFEQDQVLNMGVGLPACTTDGARRIIYDMAWPKNWKCNAVSQRATA
jgi:hypothetical protein